MLARSPEKEPECLRGKERNIGSRKVELSYFGRFGGVWPELFSFSYLLGAIPSGLKSFVSGM